MTETLVFDDPFTEGSDTNLPLHTPNTKGLGWTVIIGNPKTNTRVDAGTGTAVSPGGGGGGGPNYFAISVSESQTDAQRATFVIGTDHINEQTICVQLQDGSTGADGYRTRYATGAGELILSRVDDGAFTALGTDIAVTVVGGEVLELEIDASGNLTVRLDSVDKNTATDTNHTGGLPGIGLAKGFSADGIDDFKAWLDVAVGGANPKGPLGMPLHGPFGGPV